MGAGLIGRLRSALVAWLGGLWVVVGATATPVVVKVEADLRAQITAGQFVPGRDAVAVRGNHPPLSWQQPVLLAPAGDGRYRGDIRFETPPADGRSVAYKFRIERAGQGDGEGWEAGPNRRLRLDVAAPQIARAFDAPPDPAMLRRTGLIERLGVVPSAHVPAREVQVWLPPGYAQEAARRYPVLYLQDGQNVFDDAAAGEEWGVDETAQQLVSAGAVGPLIVVAIASGPQRGMDYTPTVDGLHGGRGGGAPAYARFLVDELKPLIDRRYRTLPDREHTAVGGSSLGGLLSFWLALQHGHVFGSALVVSPALWWDFGVAFRQLSAWTPASPRPRLWLDFGGNEGLVHLTLARRMHTSLRERGWSDADLHYLEVPDAGHDEAAWAARVEPMLRFLDAWPAAARP